jgi:hypothetical protein
MVGANTGDGSVTISYGNSSQQQTEKQVDSTVEKTNTKILNIFSHPQTSLQNLQTTFDATSPGTLDEWVAFDGSPGPGGSGYPVLVFDGSPGPGGSGYPVLVIDGTPGPGGSGYPVVAFEGGGSSGSSVLTFDGSTGSGSSILLPPPPATGSATLTVEGGGGNGSSILVPPPPETGSVSDTLVAFDGSGSNGSSIARDRYAPEAGIARVRHPNKVKFCFRRRKDSPKKCMTLKAVPVPFIATAKAALTTAGSHALRLPVSKAGKLMLTATREADRRYHKQHPHGKHAPTLGIKILVSFKPR